MPACCSVVIPTYNRKESLARTLAALGRQSLPRERFEVVVVSDGSTDGTDSYLAEHAKSGALDLHWIQRVNSGPAAARNLGVETSKNDIVVFIDDDIEPVPEHLARHLAHHEADDRTVVIGPMSPNPAWTGQEPVWIAWEHAKLQSIYAMFKPGGEFAGCDAGYEHFYSGNASVRRKWLLETGGFNTEFKRQEDVELAERLKRLCGLRFVFDFEADGLHHPVRSFESWLRIPGAYGALDAGRVRAGTLEQAKVDVLAASRNRATRVLTQLCAAYPALLSPATALLRALASGLYGIGFGSPALSLLSAVYNAHYAEAFQSAIKRDIFAPGAAV